MIKFYLNFITGGEGLKEVQEFTGFDASKFSLEQDDKRFGRDVLFAGGESNFTIYSRPEHQFELMLVYRQLYGTESEVEWIIDYNGINLTYDIDFGSMSTDQLTYITFQVLQKSKQLLLKRRSGTNVNVLSNLTLDDENILPCQIHNIFIQAKPITKNSRFTQPTPKTFVQGGNGGVTTRRFNYANQVELSGIEDTLSFIQGSGNRRDFGYIEAADTISRMNLKISNLTVSTKETADSTLGYGSLTLRWAIGFPDVDPGIGNRVFEFSFFDQPGSTSPVGLQRDLVDGSFTFSNLSMERGQRLYIWFEGFVDTQNRTYFLTTTVKSMKVEIEVVQTTLSTVNPAIRLYDIMKYVCKSVSGMDIIATDYEPGGKFYNQFLLTGNFLRGIKDKGFNMNFEQILDTICEVAADYQITTDDKVRFSLYPDFYKDIEIGVIEMIQNDAYKREYNPKYKINEFKYKFSNFQSQKEKEVDQTIDVVHGETEWLLASKKVENKKEIDVKTIRDAFQLEESRSKAYIVSDKTETQDDDKKFILDVYPAELITGNITLSETAYLRHYYDTETGRLTITNDNSFSFKLLGILADSFLPFVINTPQPNNGLYNVFEVADNYLILTPDSTATPSTANNGYKFTKFTYTIAKNTISGKAWTNEGFTTIENIANGDKYPNLRFSVKRNIINYFSQYLASANLDNLWKNKFSIKNTLYKNNPLAKTTYAGITVVEGEDFIPANPILSNELDRCVFTMDFTAYVDIENKTRDISGYVRYIDNNGIVTRGYPQKMEFTTQMDGKGKLECTMEVKHEPEVLKIFSDNETGIIRINDFISVDELSFNWTIDELGYLFIFDETGLLLFTKTLYDRVSVNGSLFENRFLLEQSLNNL